MNYIPPTLCGSMAMPTKSNHTAVDVGETANETIEPTMYPESITGKRVVPGFEGVQAHH